MNKYQYKVQGVDYDVEIVDVEGNIAQVNVNGIKFEVEMKQPINPTKSPSRPKVTAPQAPQVTKQETASPRPTQNQNAGQGQRVTAPLPGTISNILVSVGDIVKTGETIIVLEAMKMQNNIEAEQDGKITSILVNKGDTVMEGDTLITIA